MLTAWAQAEPEAYKQRAQLQRHLRATKCRARRHLPKRSASNSISFCGAHKTTRLHTKISLFNFVLRQIKTEKMFRNKFHGPTISICRNSFTKDGTYSYVRVQRQGAQMGNQIKLRATSAAQSPFSMHSWPDDLSELSVRYITVRCVCVSAGGRTAHIHVLRESNLDGFQENHGHNANGNWFNESNDIEWLRSDNEQVMHAHETSLMATGHQRIYAMHCVCVYSATWIRAYAKDSKYSLVVHTSTQFSVPHGRGHSNTVSLNYDAIHCFIH